MSSAALALADPATPFLMGGAAERLRRALLWLTGVAGAFVFIEPSPYEFVSVLTIVVFAVGGLSLRVPLMPLALLLILYNVGFAAAVATVLDQPKSLLWVLVSCYLSATAIFFAAALGTNTARRLSALMHGYTLAAAIASIAAIAGYFHVFGERGDVFLLYDRARGTFNDPNVLGAFLVLPALLALQRLVGGPGREVVRGGLLLLLLLAALFLSFSRGGWGQFILAATVLMALTFITSRSARERMRILLLAMLGVLAAVGFVGALLSIDQVADVFRERAILGQDYDVGHTGRFGRHILGTLLAFERPLGIGPLQFHKFFSEDPHNAYLNAFMSGGWLAGVSYLTLTLLTLVRGLRFAFVNTPWRPVYHALYATFVGVAIESLIIDSDHWRHYFLILGALWGLMAVSRLASGSGRSLPARRVSAQPAALAHPRIAA